MPGLIEKLADLTAHMDRDKLEMALVSTIKEMFSPRTATIWRHVGESGDAHWLSCARIGPGEQVPSANSGWADQEPLARMAHHPLRQQAMDSQQVVAQAGQPNITIFPLTKSLNTHSVLEIGTDKPLSAESRRLIAGVLRLYRNFQSLLDYGERDSLTELLNRKTFDGAFLKATIKQSDLPGPAQNERRHGLEQGSYWLGMIDIDHFKRVNDMFGHLIGDEVLLLLARLMRTCFRTHDLLYRFGGEEFVVLMRCNDEADATLVLERLRATTENHVFPQVGHISISAGFTQIRGGDTPGGAIERADKALYHAKAHGRNQVCSHAELIASGALESETANEGGVELF